MANEWTTEYPTQPGAYWMRRAQLKRWPESTSKPRIVKVDKELHFYPTDSNLPYFRSDVVSAEWFGPIQPPQEDDDYEWNDETGCSFDKSWCSAKAVHKDALGYPYCEFHWKWEQIYEKREAKAQENDK